MIKANPIKATREIRVFPVTRVVLVTRAARGDQVIWTAWIVQAVRDTLLVRDRVVQELINRVIQVTRVIQVIQVTRVIQVIQVTREIQVTQVIQVTRVIRATREIQVTQLNPRRQYPPLNFPQHSCLLHSLSCSWEP